MTGLRARSIGCVACIVAAVGCGAIAENGARTGLDGGGARAGSAAFEAGITSPDGAAATEAGVASADGASSPGCPGIGDASPATAVSVSAGKNSACALTSAGGVLCWGSNASGLLGNGSTIDSALPVQVVGLESGVKAISVGSDSACALTTMGAVLCWGGNGYGLLGNNSGGPFGPVPTPVTGLGSGAISVSVGSASPGGGAFACAVTAAGGVVCWGSDTEAQLGNGSGGVFSAVPLPVTGLASGATAVSAGTGAACAITEGGVVQCWGGDQYFSTDSGTPDGAVPATVPGLPPGVTAVSVGQGSACALTAVGQVTCWGDISQGFVQGAVGSLPVAGLSGGVTAVSVAEDGACALSAGGVASCWGDDSPEGSYPPRPLAGLEGGLTAISVNTTASCAVTANGGVDCWGYGSVGQLAGASPARSSGDPVPVAGFACTPSGVTGVGAGPGSLVASTCADPLTFADPDVESVVRQTIGLPNGPILNADVAGFTDLDLFLPNSPALTAPPTDIDYVDSPKADGIVTSLGGIECLSDLSDVGLNPYLVDLTPLGRLPKLTRLRLSQTFETSFPRMPTVTWLTAALLSNTAAGLSACPNLRVLNLTNPDFSTAEARSSLAALTGLTTLSLQGGNLTDTTALASMPFLTDVELSSNQIQDISSLSSGLANLRSLDLSLNPITDLAPLVANGNLGFGTAIAITGVSIDCTAQGPNIAALRARGVTLVTDCP